MREDRRNLQRFVVIETEPWRVVSKAVSCSMNCGREMRDGLAWAREEPGGGNKLSSSRTSRHYVPHHWTVTWRNCNRVLDGFYTRQWPRRVLGLVRAGTAAAESADWIGPAQHSNSSRPFPPRPLTSRLNST